MQRFGQEWVMWTHCVIKRVLKRLWHAEALCSRLASHRTALPHGAPQRAFGHVLYQILRVPRHA
jgi:hypothetical protein